ncbi:MAG: NAD(P)-binding protein [Candidatus Coatesbacteria bacterium]|nr:NAD(P)-binding protein [Candidatus Coatesbacteria bacterium]
MSEKRRRAHIVGAGISGLTVGHELARRGFEVVLLEKLSEVGGLARTFRYGDFSFDIGPHRFHTDREHVGEFIESVLGDEGIAIPRYSSVYLFGKYHQWPLRPKSLFRLPKSVLIKCFFDLFRRPKFTTERFDDYIKSKYGQTLYEVFFHDYTVKYNWTDPSKLHAHWASASIDRAIIDKRASMNSLWDTLKVTLLPKPVTTQFLYPKHGVDVFCRKLRESIEAQGGRIVCGVKNIELESADKKVKSIEYDGQKDDVDVLVWTAPLPLLAEKMGIDKPNLRYLSLVAYNVEIDHKATLPDQWIYYPSKGLDIARVSFPENFSPFMVPEGKGGICIEITTLGPPSMDYAESKRESIINDMEKVGLSTRSNILNVHIELVENTYPLYELGYVQEKERFNKALSKFGNVHLAGRTGLFWYNNMDNSIEQALQLAEEISPEGKGQT